MLTAGYVQGLYRWGLRQRQEQGLRSFIREIRQMYDMRRPVRIPKEYRTISQEVRSGQTLLRDIADRITASLTKEPPVFQVGARDDTVDTKEAASIAGRWLGGTVEDMQRMSREDVIYLAAKALIRDSESVIKIVHRPDAWANFPGRMANEDPKKYTARADRYAKGSVIDPFAWREVDRLQMLFGDGEYGDEWALEWGQYVHPYTTDSALPSGEPTPQATLAGPPVSEEDPAGLGGTRSIKIELFTGPTYPGYPNEWAVVINGRMAPGFPRENPYKPFLPYIRAVAPPALYPLRFLAPALDALETMQMNWAFLTAWPKVAIEALAGVQHMLDTLPVGDTSEPPPDIKPMDLGAWFPPPGYSMRFLEPPAAGRELHQMKADIREMIDVVGIPSVFRGQGGARQPGYSISQLISASQMTYDKVVDGLERQQENVARFLFNCVGSVTGQTIYVLGAEGDAKKWLGLKPTGNVQQYVAPVDQLGAPDCHFRPVLPTDDEKALMIITQALNSPNRPLSHETLLTRYLQFDDPLGEIDRICAERKLEEEPLATDIVTEAKRLAGLPPTPPPAPPLLAPPAGNGLVPPEAAVAPPATIPVAPPSPGTPLPAPPPQGGVGPGVGGRPAGAYPGLPGGPNR